ncbi:MAG: cyclic nucleotide-binding domain-containing protein [Xanthobacteraceae bacterium]|jgi:CRP-like cAMP-binding protein
MAKKKDVFDPKAILTGHGAGQARRQFAPGQIVYAQDDPADAAYYVENGLIKISSLSPSGKEAVIAIRGKGEFFGTRCLVARRTATTTALTPAPLSG